MVSFEVMAKPLPFGAFMGVSEIKNSQKAQNGPQKPNV